MNEEIKKELKEIKEEIKSSEEKITSEKVEGLIEKLTEEIQEEVPEKEEKLKFKYILPILGCVFSLLLLIIGIFVGLKLIKSSSLKKKKTVSQIVFPEPEVINSGDEILKRYSKIIIKNQKEKSEYPYKMEFKNFLIPLGSKDFLKLDVFFLF